MNRKTSLGLALGLVTSTMLGVQTLMMSGVKAETQQLIDQTQVTPLLGKPANPQHAVPQSIQATGIQAASICYTCGGDFPIYGGTIYTSIGANERNSECGTFAGGVEFSTEKHDTAPFLCTK